MIFSCICGGLEFVVLGIAILIPIVAKKFSKICKKSCKCECHENSNKSNEPEFGENVAGGMPGDID